MAVDWIKMRIDLQTHPKVVRIMSATKSDKFRVVGGLHAVWSVFDAHSEDGVLCGYSRDLMDSVIGYPGLSAAMCEVGWLMESAQGIVMPEFTEHNGKSAKRRAEDQKRKRESRKCPQKSGHNEDKERTREEKRREEKKDQNTMSSTLDFAVKDSPEVEALKYLNSQTGREYKAVESNLKLIRARIKEGATLEDLMAVVDLKVSQWADNPKMREYLRPATLFNAEKFNQYVAQAKDPGFKDGIDEWLAEMGASNGDPIDGEFFEVKDG